MRNPRSFDVMDPSAPVRRPLYESYCFARLPATIARLLVGDAIDPADALPDDVFGDLPRRYDTVVLFFCDAFGWHFYDRWCRQLPALRRFEEQGVVSRMTAQFPSTTAAHVTCIHTGLPVGQSGVFEWNYYEPHPQVDRVITPLPFTEPGEGAGALAKRGVRPADLLPPARLYRDWARLGIESTVLQHLHYTPSPYSDEVFAGATVVPFGSLPEGLAQLSGRLLKPASGPRYFFLYHDRIDFVGHQLGPDSHNFAAAIRETFTELERFFEDVISRSGRALFLLTADHGQIGVNPASTLYLNRMVPDLIDDLKVNRQGEPILFGGSPRDLFLYVREDRIADVRARLERLLDGLAVVWPIERLIAEGFFGPEISERLRARLGNLVILPEPGETVYWLDPGRFAMQFYGHHGGWSPVEMDTGLYALPL
jgi:predicted AlkP superfamily pyrophosphatase or phosphodiesterase